MVQKNKYTTFERSFIAFGKKWLMPEDDSRIVFEGRAYELQAQQEQGYPLRLFFSRGTTIVAMWTFNDDTNKWMNESRYAKDVYSLPKHKTFGGEAQ